MIAALALVAAACGGGSSEEAPTTVSAPDPTTTTMTSAPDGATTTTSAPDGAGTAGAIVVAPGWVLTPIGNGIKPILAIDTAGLPAIAWLVEELEEGFVAYAAAAQGWDEDRFVEGYFYGPIGLDFDPAGDPHVAYHDHQANSFQPELGDLTHAVRRLGDWDIEAAADDGHDGWDTTITIGTDGVVRAAGIDPQQFQSPDGVEYYELTEDGWQITAIGSGPIEYEWNVSLAVSDTGRVALSYHDNNTRQLVFAELDDGSWSLDIVDSDGDAGRFSSLAFDAAGTAHISYFAADEGTVRYATEAADGWLIEEVARLEDVEISFTGARRITAIDLDSAGGPHIVFGDRSVVGYGERTAAGQWEISDILTAGDRSFGQLVTFELDSADTPHIATYEGSAAESEDSVIVYITPGS